MKMKGYVPILCVVLGCMVLHARGDDTGATATPLATITTNTQTYGPDTLNTDDVADWFSVDLEAGKRYRFESTILSNTPGLDIDAYLYSDSGGSSEVAYNEDSGEGLNFQLLYVPDTAGTYYLMLANYYYGYVPYEFDYYEEPLLDAWDTADDVYSNAPMLTADVVAQEHGPHHLSASDTLDWFRFVLLGGVDYTFSSLGGWDTVGELYDNTLSMVESGDQEGEENNFRITYIPPDSGVYYLKVKNYTPYWIGENSNYNLEYYASANPDSDDDGSSDVNEYIAGTNPSNSASYFAITNWSASNLVLEWTAIAGREYRVFWTDHLTNDFLQVGPVIDFPQNSYTDTVHNAEASGFYQVDVQLKP